MEWEQKFMSSVAALLRAAKQWLQKAATAEYEEFWILTPQGAKPSPLREEGSALLKRAEQLLDDIVKYVVQHGEDVRFAKHLLRQPHILAQVAIPLGRGEAEEYTYVLPCSQQFLAAREELKSSTARIRAVLAENRFIE